MGALKGGCACAFSAGEGATCDGVGIGVGAEPGLCLLREACGEGEGFELLAEGERDVAGGNEAVGVLCAEGEDEARTVEGGVCYLGVEGEGEGAFVVGGDVDGAIWEERGATRDGGEGGCGGRAGDGEGCGAVEARFGEDAFFERIEPITREGVDGGWWRRGG